MRAKEVFATTQDKIRDLQQSSRDDEETAQEVTRHQQKWPGNGQGTKEHADPRGGEVEIGRILRAEPQECNKELIIISFNNNSI